MMRRLFFIVIALGIALCIGNAFLAGKREGRDAKLVYGVFNDLTALAIAISEDRYGFHEGYIGRPEVIEALGRHLAPDGLMVGTPSQASLAANPKVVQAALDEATALDPKIFRPFKSVREPFVVMGGEDTGLVNFYRLAFFLFGYEADAMYHTYFLLLVGSCIVFLWQARGQPVFCAALLALMFGFQTLSYLDVFSSIAAPTVYCNRNIGTLAMVATLHIMLFPWMQRRDAVVMPWLLLLLQVVLLLFVMTIRSSTMWQWISIWMWLGVVVVGAVWYQRKNLWVAVSSQKHILLLMAVLAYVSHVHHRERMNAHDDIYFTNCTMPYHLRWHSAYLAFDLHPEWPEYAPSATDGVLHGDSVGWNVARAYWKRKNPDSPRYTCKAFTYYPLFGAHDFVMRKEFFRFVGKHPGFVAELHLYYKPKAIIEKVQASLALLPEGWGMQALLVAGLSLMAALATSQVAVMAAGAAVALLALNVNMPAMFAYPSYMAETVMLVLAVIAFLPVFAVAVIRRVLRKGKSQDASQNRA